MPASLLNKVKKIRRRFLMDRRNSAGWATDKKIVVIESDDWGSIRTASKRAYKAMLDGGDRIDSDPFTMNDSLAGEDDLELLFGVLSGYKDLNGAHPVLTVNCAVANPDFDRIRESGYQEYFYEHFTETLKRYPKHSRSFSLWKEGMKNGIFHPQLHCREHVNIVKWMGDLKSGNENLRLAFDNRMISGANSFSSDNPFAYMDAFNYRDPIYNRLIKEILYDASRSFEQTFGYKSKSFIPPCCVWSDTLEDGLEMTGAEYIQGDIYQKYPHGSNYGDFKKIRHSMGDRSKAGLIYMVRNCFFEPSFDINEDHVDICLAQIASAFRMHKPAVIGSHRMNYIGFINEKNRDTNLLLLDRLLKEIIKKWPDVEFTTTDRLGDIM